MSFHWLLLLSFLLLSPRLAWSQADQVYLFEASHLRALAGLERQKARKVRAEADYERAVPLLRIQVISLQEYETLRTINLLARYDLQIAEMRARQATISLQLAHALERSGQRIPLCKRKRQANDDTVTDLHDRLQLAKQSRPSEQLSPSGTRIEIPNPYSLAPTPRPHIPGELPEGRPPTGGEPRPGNDRGGDGSGGGPSGPHSGGGGGHSGGDGSGNGGGDNGADGSGQPQSGE